MTAPATPPNNSSQSRYFLALIPPPDIQAEATALKHYFREKFRSQAALKSPPHITLQAPFTWPDQERDRLFNTLATFRPSASSIPVHLSGFGAFPPRVIFLAVQPASALMQLQAELSQYLAKTLGIVDPKARDRPFRPHLTVAFRDLKPVAFRRAWPEFERQSAEYRFTATAIVLLRHTGQVWEPLRDLKYS
ncbi:2'-5' RNA ligase family protein [Halomicronema sp. CCY15110]|uniref:2'-5' RNA ligase family protein n=1 Tax=Halomicronema sp. CCY15110 TaxID=2767773 RepID=UPI00194E3D86|nr:2'-5' RNA ligase family protein [Halomicronema sp. CCY15110]